MLVGVFLGLEPLRRRPVRLHARDSRRRGPRGGGALRPAGRAGAAPGADLQDRRPDGRRAQDGRVVLGARAAVPSWVERFGRRETEPNDLFRSEFGQNSFKIQAFSLEKSKKNVRKFKNSEKFNSYIF